MTIIDEKYGQVVIAVHDETGMEGLVATLNALEPNNRQEFTLPMVEALVAYASVAGVTTAAQYIEHVAEKVDGFEGMSSQGMTSVRSAYAGQMAMNRRVQAQSNRIQATENLEIAELQAHTRRLSPPTRNQQDKVSQIILLLRSNGMERHADAIENQLLDPAFETSQDSYSNLLNRFIPILEGRGVVVPPINASDNSSATVTTEFKSTPDLEPPSATHESDVVIETVSNDDPEDPFAG